MAGFFKNAPPQHQIIINTPTPAQPTVQAVLPPQQPNTIFLTVEKYEANLQQARDEVLAQIPDASGEHLQDLTRKREEFETRLANIEPAFEQAKARIAELETIIEREGNLLGAEDLAEAEAALANGDFDAAEQLLIRIEDQGDLEVKRTARAAYGRGQIAEEQVRWLDAAKHYAKAARLDPTFENLRQDWDFLWKLGKGAEALRVAGLLKFAAIEKSGVESDDYANALSCEAESLRMLGRFEDTEPVMRETIEIGKATSGETHPAYAIRLNNLAELLRAMGRYDEAEPLFRQAVEIDKATIGETHPDYAIHLNNLATLLQNTGRYDAAEPLFRQAIEITKATIGETHPDYATYLNNLANLLADMGRYDAAEPLYRQAIEIDKATIGETHPDYATRLNNLALLLQNMGRYDEARPMHAQHHEIEMNALGQDHPNTILGAANYARLLRTHFADDPALAELESTFGPDIGR